MKNKLLIQFHLDRWYLFPSTNVKRYLSCLGCDSKSLTFLFFTIIFSNDVNE